ncbi:MAG: cytochrome c [Parvularculaceae bacterium]
MSWVYLASEFHARSFKQPPPFDHPIPTDAEAIARGDHLVRTRGCRGCHGDNLEGEVMWGAAVAPNLPQLARSAGPAAIEAGMRHGIDHRGRAMYMMPSFNFLRMRDDDVADIIAYLQTAPVVEKKLPKPKFPWALRFAIAAGKDDFIPGFLYAVPELQRQDDPDPRIARSEYIAMTSCNECHGMTLRGDYPWGDNPEDGAPDLIIAGSYTEEDFRKLMKTGIAVGERELRMMSGVARGRFAHFTDDEVTDLYVFLQDMSRRALEEQTP